ncbi:hypothetical protein F1880_007675 [Penicillium rolfsii]|nr:hypothetical protein F1880_007675 [Penicillium rolfsii]
MGVLRDAIGSALGANQINNGLSGPALPFIKSSNRDNGRFSSLVHQQSRSRSPSQRYNSYEDYNDRGNSSGTGYQVPAIRSTRGSMQGRHNNDRYQYSHEPPRYERPASGGMEGQFYDSQPQDMGCVADLTQFGEPRFRPLALPQIGYGNGEPFLRGYSIDLGRYGVSEEAFIGLVDAINVAIIPNPENQIFQKGANIAGWFLPGAAGIGLMVGQIGVGLGTHLGHASAVARVLSSANLQVFLPRGLEICIGKTQDVEASVGLAAPPGPRTNSFGISPEGRLAFFGDLIAPLSLLLPPLQQIGRNDPAAMLGRTLANRTNQKKMQKAEKDITKGKKNKNLDSLEGGLKWLIVRPASSEALAYWRNSLNDQSQTQAGYGRR